MTLEVTPLGPGDRDEWERLARAYKAFYETHAAGRGRTNVPGTGS